MRDCVCSRERVYTCVQYSTRVNPCLDGLDELLEPQRGRGGRGALGEDGDELFVARQAGPPHCGWGGGRVVGGEAWIRGSARRRAVCRSAALRGGMQCNAIQ